MRILIVTLVLSTSMAACSTPQSKPTVKLLHLADLTSADDSALQDCEEHCDPDDAALVKSLHPMIKLMTQRKQGTEPAFKELDTLMTQARAAAEVWFDNKKDSADPQEAITAFQLGYSLEGLPKQSSHQSWSRFEEKLRLGIPDLPKRFPHEPRAHFLNAKLLESEMGPPEEIIRSYKRCLELDPRDSWCGKSYSDAGNEYEATFCKGEDLDSSLGFYLSSPERNAQYPKTLRFQPKNIFVQKTPRLVGKDIARLRVVPPGPNQSGAVDELQIEMTPAGARKLSDLTTNNVRKFLAVAVKGRAILNASINTPVTGGLVVVTMGMDPKNGDRAERVFADACRKPTTRRVPRDLRLQSEAPPKGSI
ncbi:MAG: SecDF P1 head subdomain-containing protein [Bdellovibrionota bacterium]